MNLLNIYKLCAVCLLGMLSGMESISGQQFFGMVISSDGDAMTGATVVLLDSLDHFVDHDITDGEGKWTIECETYCNCKKLKFNYLGYKEVKLELNSETTSPGMEIVMEPMSQMIREIIIKDKAIAFTRNGDTTSFNLHCYRTRTDKCIGDILNKLPGLEVVKDGRIEYNGRKLDKLLVEGKEILNDQHKLTAEGFGAEDVGKIQIIEQYQSFNQQFSKEWSDKVAMNIVLTDECKGRIKGDVEVSGGPESKYEVASSVYSIDEKIGITNFIRSNNVGEPAVSLSDFLSLKSSLLRTLNQTNGDLEQIIPTEFGRPENAQRSHENLLAANAEIQHGEKSTSRIAFLGSYFNRKSQSGIDRLYLQSNDRYTGEEKLNTKFSYLYLNMNNKAVLSRRSSLEFDLPMSVDLSDSDLLSSGTLKTNITDRRFENGQTDVELSPHLFWNYKMSDHHILKAELGYTYRQANKDISIDSDVPLFGSEQVSIYQSSRSTTSNTHALLKWQYARNKIRSGISLNMRNTVNEISIAGNFTASEETDMGKSIWTSFSPEYYLGYKSRYFWVEGRLKWTYHCLDIDGVRRQHLPLSPSLLLRYNFRKLHYILLRAGQSKGPVDPSFSFDLRRIVDERTLLISSLQNGQEMQSRSLSFTHLWMDVVSKSRIHTVLTYNPVRNPVFFTSESEGDFIVRKAVLAERSSSLVYKTAIDHRIFNNKILLKAKAGYNSTAMKVTDQKAIRLSTRNAGLGIQTNLKQSINTELFYTRSLVRQKYEAVNTSFATHSIRGSIKYAQQKWTAETDLDYIQRKNTDDSYGFLIWNATVDYRLNERWNIIFHARDILNLTSETAFSAHYNHLYFEQSRYLRFPGSLSLGVSKSF